MRVLVPDTIELDLTLPDDVEAVRYDASRPLPDELADAEVLVAWGSSGELFRTYAEQLTNLRLVQALLAGPDPVLAAGFRPEAAICSGVGLHSRTVTEHALALTLHLVRRLPACAAAQREHVWSAELGGVQPLHPHDRVTTLLDAHVTIWGFGAIGQTLAPLLAGLGAQVTGVARGAGERSGFPVVSEDDLGELLGRTDVLIMILPSGEATQHALNAERLAQLPDHAYVVNVGRGSSVDEAALVDALARGAIAGAALDVTETEPLPADSPVWDAPNLVLTPHAAGGRPVGADELIEHNVRALLDGRDLRNLVR